MQKDSDKLLACYTLDGLPIGNSEMEAEEQSAFLLASISGLNGAYSDDGPEYDIDMVKELNKNFNH